MGILKLNEDLNNKIIVLALNTYFKCRHKYKIASLFQWVETL